MKKDYIVWSQVDTDGVLHQVLDLVAYVKANRPERLAQYESFIQSKNKSAKKAAKDFPAIKKPA